jgi:hypothetical protein
MHQASLIFGQLRFKNSASTNIWCSRGARKTVHPRLEGKQAGAEAGAFEEFPARPDRGLN